MKPISNLAFLTAGRRPPEMPRTDSRPVAVRAGSAPKTLQIAGEVADPHFQGFGDAGQHGHRHLEFSAFNVANVIARQAGLFGQVILRQPQFRPAGADGLAENPGNSVFAFTLRHCASQAFSRGFLNQTNWVFFPCTKIVSLLKSLMLRQNLMISKGWAGQKKQNKI